jgi:hypothetical protein
VLVLAAAFVVDMAAFLAWGLPVVPVVLVAFVLLWVSAGRRHLLAGVAHDLSLPLVVGLTIISVSLLVLNTYEAGADPERVRSAELALARLRLGIADVTHLSVTRILVVGSLLLVAAVVAARVVPVTRAKQAHALVGFLQLVLLVLTTFVVYAQAPLQTEVRDSHAKLEAHYRVALNKQWDAQVELAAEKAAAASVRDTVQSLDPPRRAEFRRLLREIETQAASLPKPSAGAVSSLAQVDGVWEVAGEVAGLAVPELGGDTADLRERALSARGAVVEGTPTSRGQLATQKQAVELAELRAVRVDGRRSAQLGHLTTTTARELAKLFLPQLGTAETLLEALIDRVADRIEPSVETALLTANTRSVDASGLTVPELADRVRATAPKVAFDSVRTMTRVSSWRPLVEEARSHAEFSVHQGNLARVERPVPPRAEFKLKLPARIP